MRLSFVCVCVYPIIDILLYRNFKIFNLHHGSQVTEIGHDLGGTFNLFRDPIYFDETKMVRSTEDERRSLGQLSVH